MVILVVESWYPASLANRVGKKYLDVIKEYPPDKNISKQILGAVKAEKEGFHTIFAWNVKEGKTEDALKRMVEAMLMFGEIEGYRYQIDTYLSVAEAMPMIGLELPAPAV